MCVRERKYFCPFATISPNREFQWQKIPLLLCSIYNRIILKRNEPNLFSSKNATFQPSFNSSSIWAIHELREKKRRERKMKGKIRNNKKTSLLLSLWLLAAFFPSNSKRQESCNVCDVMVLVNNCFCIWKNAVNKMEREEVNLSWGKSIIFGAFGYSFLRIVSRTILEVSNIISHGARR